MTPEQKVGELFDRALTEILEGQQVNMLYYLALCPPDKWDDLKEAIEGAQFLYTHYYKQK